MLNEQRHSSDVSERLIPCSLLELLLLLLFRAPAGLMAPAPNREVTL